MQHRKQTLIPLLFAGILSLATAQAMAKDDAHHHHDGGTSAGLSLNNGAKWKTDAPLRQGMKNIRNVLEPQLPAIHNNKLKPAQYQALARAINDELSAIVMSCKLDKDADAMLHLVLADITEGVDALAGKNKQVGRHDGAVKVYKGLENYKTYFDHPNWQPMTHGE
jgi:hypothetical protein